MQRPSAPEATTDHSFPRVPSPHLHHTGTPFLSLRHEHPEGDRWGSGGHEGEEGLRGAGPVSAWVSQRPAWCSRPAPAGKPPPTMATAGRAGGDVLS